MGKRTDSGSLVRATPITFNKGDFVDVLVSFEVVRLDEKDIVHLHLDTIIQLKPANEMRTVCTTSRSFPIPSEPNPSHLAFPQSHFVHRGSRSRQHSRPNGFCL